MMVFKNNLILENVRYIFKVIHKLPKLQIRDSIIDAKLILFDFDGNLIDDSERYTSLARFRYKSLFL